MHRFVLFCSIFVIIFGSSTADGNDDVPFFDLLVNLTMHNESREEFAQNLADAISASRDTIFFESMTSLSSAAVSGVKSLCVDDLRNISAEEASHLVRINLTFVGDFDTAADASNNLEVMSSCRMGIYTLATKSGIPSVASVPRSVKVTLRSDEMTPDLIVLNLSSYFRISASVFFISDQLAANDTFNLTIVGAHTELIERHILNLTDSELIKLGASAISSYSFDSVDGGTSSGMSVSTISIVTIVCGVILVFMLILCVRWNKGDCPVSGEDQDHLNTVRIWRIRHRRVHSTSSSANDAKREATSRRVSEGNTLPNEFYEGDHNEQVVGVVMSTSQLDASRTSVIEMH